MRLILCFLLLIASLNAGAHSRQGFVESGGISGVSTSESGGDTTLTQDSGGDFIFTTTGGSFNENLILQLNEVNNQIYIDSDEATRMVWFGTFQATNGFVANGGSLISWTSSTEMFDFDDAQLVIRRANNSTGACLDFFVSDTLRLRAQADCTSAATFDVANINVTGSITGAGSTLHGEMSIDESSTATTINTINVWEEVNATDVVTGDLNGWTYATGDLTAGASSAGTYLLSASISASGTGGDTLQFAASIDDAIQSDCKSTHEVNSGGDTASVSLHCITDIAASDVVKLEMRNTSGTNNITVEQMSFAMTRI